MKTLRILAIMSALATTAFAENKVGFENADTVAGILKRQVGQKVELRLKSGQNIAGKIEAVGDKMVHISAVSGQEFFDAVIVIEDVSAILIRTK